MSRRQDIITALLNRLKTITTSNGYNTNAGNNVKEWQTFEAAPAELGDMIIVKDVSCNNTEGEEDDNAGTYWTKKLSVQVICLTEGKTSSSKLRDMIEDVIIALGVDDTFAGICEPVEYEGDQTDVDRQGKTYGGTLINLGITYRVTRWTD